MNNQNPAQRFWQQLNNKHIVVVGLGKTGASVVRYLTQQGAKVSVWDTRAQVNISAIADDFIDVEMLVGEQALEFWQNIDGVVLSPGVSPSSAALASVFQAGCAVIGDIELYAHAVKQLQSPPRVVAITGSNGKSTCTLLTAHILNQIGISAVAAGNLGTPALDTLGGKHAVTVLELSSFQLETTASLNLDVACFLNLSDDHLDRHGTIQAYGESKQRIYNSAKTAVFWRGQRETAPVAPVANQISFGLDEQVQSWSFANGAITFQGNPVVEQSSIPMAGLHNIENTMACCAIAVALGAQLQQLDDAIATFQPPPHRCVTISQSLGVSWIDDSKATNPGATLAALNGIGPQIKGRLFLIAGGDAKGADLSVLKSAFSQYVHKLIAIGKDAQALLNIHANSHLAASLEAAVSMLIAEVKANDVVLLSPACASLDMFDNYAHRAQVFTQAVAEVSK